MATGCEALDPLQEGEEGLPHTQGALGPILSWDAESLRQGCGIKQQQIAHDTVSSCLVSIISITQRMARQQKSVGGGILHTLPTP